MEPEYLGQTARATVRDASAFGASALPPALPNGVDRALRQAFAAPETQDRDWAALLDKLRRIIDPC
jgi:hypothetical protein